MYVHTEARVSAQPRRTSPVRVVALPQYGPGPGGGGPGEVRGPPWYAVRTNRRASPDSERNAPTYRHRPAESSTPPASPGYSATSPC